MTNPNDGKPCLVCGNPYDVLPRNFPIPGGLHPVGAIINRPTKQDPGPDDYIQHFFCIVHFQNYERYLEEVKSGERIPYI